MRCLCLLAALLVCLAGRADAESRQPNFVVIIVDDMGWADLGCYGSKAVQTPHLDQMAAEGLRFTDAYSGCTVCAPARSTLMTGYHMGHTSVRSNSGGAPLLDEDVTVAEVLKSAGYTVGGFGKWGLGDLSTSGAAEKQGFDRFYGYYHQVHAHAHFPDYLIDTGEKHMLTGNLKDGTVRKGAVPSVDPETGAHRQFAPELIFQEMKQFLIDHHEEPFLCYAPWTPPHGRYEVPADDPAWKLYADKNWPVDAKVHAAFCTLVDRYAGETLALLRELGVADNTLVLFMSDNGAAQRFEGSLDSCGPLRGFKRSMYEGGLRVPLIARWPGKIAPGTVSDHQTYFPDLMPTLAELAGAADGVPEDIDGISLVPELMGDSDKRSEHPYLYWEYSRMKWGPQPEMLPEKTAAAIRQGEWKAVRGQFDAPIELYHLPSDLGEKHNVADQQPDRVAQFAKLFDEAHEPPRAQPEPKHAEGRRFE